MYAESNIESNTTTMSPNKYPSGSFKSQFYQDYAPGASLGPLDIPELKQKLVSSMESQHGSLMRMISGMTPTANDSTLCRDYTCCGIQLSDLHALVEHFEEQHVIVMDSPLIQPMAGPTINTNIVVSGNTNVPSSASTSKLSPSDPPIDTMDEMDLDVDIDDSHSSGSGTHSGDSSPSPPLTPVLPFDTTAIRRPSSTFSTIPLVSGGSASTSPRLETALNRYSEYTEFSAMLPGTINSSDAGEAGRAGLHSRTMSKSKTCLPPALLSSNNTPQSSRAPSPTNAGGSAGSFNPSLQASSSTTTLSRPASSLLLAKPFRCPKPGCNKSYKQANGLKYHLQHGSCNFAPRDESIDCLSEKEAEARLKPYQCQVPPCTRRYKNMNGLRYHYQHSGAHGAIGLALLASGQHEHIHTNHHHHTSSSSSGEYNYKMSRSRPSSVVSSANNSAQSSPVPSRTGTPLGSPITPTQGQVHSANFAFFNQMPSSPTTPQSFQSQRASDDIAMA